ncbi:subtilisin-like protein [Diplocarpon rosae]|nr:subtilisin-like protein [Diplocarpon rosae]
MSPALLTPPPKIAWIEPDTRVRTLALTSQFNASWGLSRISHREANGHGTHCAGIIGSRSYGVAKKACLIGVKVLGADGSGSLSNIVAGIEWAVDDAREKGRIGRAVANLSFGGFYSRTGNAAVRAGLFVGVAAGNDGAPAFLTTPASEKTACTVGASDIMDTRVPYSNFGSVVDIFAPGKNIISTWIGGPTRTNARSGTSMATPYIVGLAAYLMGLEGPKEPGLLCEQMRRMATKKKLSGTSRWFLSGLMGTPICWLIMIMVPRQAAFQVSQERGS